MTTWQEQFQQHAVHETLTQAEAALKALGDEKHAEYRDQLARLRHVLIYCRNALEQVDTQITPISALNSLHDCLTGFKNELTAFAADNQAAHLETANAKADDVLNILPRLPQLPEAQRKSPLLKQRVAEYEEEIERLIRLLRERTGKIEGALEEISKAIDEKNRQLFEDFGAKAQKMEQGFNEKNTKLTEELKKLTEEISTQKTNLDQIASNFTQQFTDAQGKRLTDFNAELKQWKEQFEAAFKTEKESAQTEIKKLKDDADDLRKALNEKVDNLIAAIEEKDAKAAQLLEAIGIKSFAGHYRQQANKERRAANIFQWMALFFLFALLCYAIEPSMPEFIKQFLPIKTIPASVGATQAETSLGWEIIKHILLYLAFLGPALYAAYESAKHRKQEHKIRQFELEMAAVHPYFAAIPDSPEKDKKRIDLADRFFGHQVDEQLEAWQPPALKGLSGLIDTLGNFANKIK